MIRHIFTVLLATITCTLLYFFCESQTHGFRFYTLLSDLPQNPKWESAPPSPEVKERLNQSFKFLGSGGWCIAFLGEDNETVLKFYKHTHLEPIRYLTPFKSHPSSNFHTFNFESCQLLSSLVNAHTALLHTHLSHTDNELGSVTLYDPIGIKHTLNLDTTEFVMQKKATPILPHLENLIQQGKPESAKRCIENMLTTLSTVRSKGLVDVDTSFRNNYGFIGEEAIIIDLSSFVFDNSLKDLPSHQEAVAKKTHKLRHFLKKYHPELLSCYDDALTNL